MSGKKLSGPTAVGALVAMGIGGLALWVRLTTLQTKPHQPASLTVPPTAPPYPAHKPLKILTWNVQYMAGKNHFFFYEGGPDIAPTPADVRGTLDEVARVLLDEDADVVFLQEVDCGATRTHHTDQITALQERLHGRYPCLASTPYWQARYVPHPKVRLGQVHMRLVTLSKYRLKSATRHQLPHHPHPPVLRHFYPKRAILETPLVLSDGREVSLLNTHFEAFSIGTDTLARQVAFTQTWLAEREQAGRPWLLGGDFNALPPGQWGRLAPAEQAFFNADTELQPLYERYATAVRHGRALTHEDWRPWFTMNPNHPDFPEPNVTLDHLFASGLSFGNTAVRQHDTRHISDHLPLIATVNLS